MSEFFPYKRVIILALDSVNWDLLLPLLNDGTMPALNAFLKRANYGVLQSTVPPHTAAAWTTFLTGKDPGRHGVIDFVRFDPVKHTFKFHDSSLHRRDYFLSRLTEAGFSCGSIFLPRNYPPYSLENGYVVSGFETPSTKSNFTEPRMLKDEVLSIFPDFHFNFEDDWEADFDDDFAFDRNIQRAMGAVDFLERLGIHFQRERPKDIQICYLQATDILFHKAWKWVDAKTASSNERRRDGIKKFFRRIDLMINRVLNLHSSASRRITAPIPPPTLRLIVSDHGHGLSKGRVYVNNVLMEWGYLKPLRGLSSITQRLKKLTFDQAERRARNKEMELDWSQTRAYLAHVGIYGFVYINLKGREQHGIVPPEKYESLRNELIEKFLALKIPGTTDPVFPKVLKGEEAYARKKELNLPDLILVPAEGYFPRKKITKGAAVRPTPNAIGGVHHPDGIYAFDGPGIQPSTGIGERCNIADIAPTLFAALGQPVPCEMTGKPMTHIFQKPPDIRFTDSGGTIPPPPSAPDATVYSEDEQAEVEKRLADLGYLE